MSFTYLQGWLLYNFISFAIQCFFSQDCVLIYYLLSDVKIKHNYILIKDFVQYSFPCLFSGVPKKKNLAPRGRPRNDSRIHYENISTDPDYVPIVKQGRGHPRKNFSEPENAR